MVHQFSASGTVSLLAGGDAIDAGAVVFVPVLDDIEDAPFTGEYVLSAGRAWAAVREFLRDGSVEDLGEWEEL